MNKTDVAVLVVDASRGFGDCDRELISLFREKEIPYIIALNKSDLLDSAKNFEADGVPGGSPADHFIYVSAEHHTGIEELKERISKLTVTGNTKLQIVGRSDQSFRFYCTCRTH